MRANQMRDEPVDYVKEAMDAMFRDFSASQVRREVYSVPMPKGGWPRFDVLHGWSYPGRQLFSLLNMPGAE